MSIESVGMKAERSRSRAWRGAFHVALFATVLALAGFDWFVSPLGADDANTVRNAIDAPRPTAVAPARDLTSSSTEGVRLGDIECRVVRTGDVYRLQAHNTGRTRASLRMRVERVEMVGELYARMGPMPQVVASDVVTLALAPGGRSSHALSANGRAGQPAALPVAVGNATPVAPIAPAGVGFRAVDFRLHVDGQPAETARILRFAERAGRAAIVAPSPTVPNG